MTYNEVLNIWNDYYTRHICMGTECENTFMIDDNTYSVEIDRNNVVRFNLIDFNRDISELIVDEFVYGVKLIDSHRNYKLKSVRLSDSVRVIGDNCFKNCLNLESINLDKVEYIGSSAFKNTFHLKNVTFSKDLLYIGTRSFEHSGLEIIDFTGCCKIQNLGTASFSYCMNLKNVANLYCVFKSEYDSEIKHHGLQEGIFKGCSNLESVSIFHLDNISKEMFSNCCNLKSVDIKQKRIHFCIDSFWGCKSLDNIYAHSTSLIDGLDFCGDVKIFLDKYKLNADGHKVEIKNEQKLFKDSIVELIHNFDNTEFLEVEYE